MAPHGGLYGYKDGNTAQPAVYSLNRIGAEGLMKMTRTSTWRRALAPARTAIACLGIFALAALLPGCAPTIASVAGGGLAVGELAGIKASERAGDRHVPGPRDEQGERCDALAADPPGVEEVRNRNGLIESREWKLVPGKSAPRWEMITEPGADAYGWAPKPHIARLGFTPPLASLLHDAEPRFLAYAPFTVETIADSQKMNVVRETFGPADGTFMWRGRQYGFTIVKDLPCFKPTM